MRDLKLVSLFLAIFGFTFLTGAADRKIDAGIIEFKHASAPSSPSSGYSRCYVKTDNKFYCKTSAGVEAEVTAPESLQKKITQSSHGFSVGEAIFHNGTEYIRSIANVDSLSEVEGIVSEVVDSNTFKITLYGYVSGLSGLTAGRVYYLSDSVSGGYTSTEPNTNSYVSKPLFRADSTTSGYFLNMRGNVIGGGTNGTDKSSAIRSVGSSSSTSGAMVAYWQGYHDDDCNFSTTTTGSWIDLGDSTCTFVDSGPESSGFPAVSTVTDGGSTEYPGIKFTTTRAANYEVCALIETNTSAASFYGLSLYDATNGVRKAHVNRQGGGTTNVSDTLTVCGIFTYASGVTFDVRLMAYLDGAQTARIGYSNGSFAGAQQAIQWTVRVYEQ